MRSTLDRWRRSSLPNRTAIERWAIVLVSALAVHPGRANADEAPPPKPAPIAAVYELQVEPLVWKKLFDLPDNHRCNSPRVSAVGRRLAFDGWNKPAGESSASAKVFITNLDGSDMKSVCVGGMPSLSPDGKRFACSRYGVDQGVWIMDLEGGGERLDPAGWGIQWSPDGDSVAYRRGRNIVVRTLATGDERLLFPAEATPFSAIYWNMAWSADSRKIAMVATNQPNAFELAIVDAQGAEFGFTRRAAGNLIPSLTWNADGRRLVYPEKVANAYVFREVDPATQDAPISVPGLPADSKATSATWSPDGSRLIVICNFN